MKSLLNRILIALTLTCLFACGGSGTDTTGNTDTTGTSGATNNNPNGNNNAQTNGNVTSKLETVNGITYKIYLQPEANANNRKGIVLLGSGNLDKTSDPVTGDLNGPIENKTAEELAKNGYVSAIVAYRDQPEIDFGDGGVSWNKTSQELASDMSTVADAIIKSNPGLSRNRVITGGVSYTSFMLLTNIALDSTPLADTRGVLAACGGSDDNTQALKIPIFNLNCKGSPDDGTYFGESLYSRITNAAVKADSGFYTDDSCNSHCGGDVNNWASKMVERTQLWLP